MVNYENENAPLADRARAYLEINCGHCHRAEGGLKYDIVKGNADQSILTFRMESTDPGIMMPELGRKMVHKEGLALVKQWINGDGMILS